MRVARVGFILLSVAWVALLVAAPVAALGVSASALTYAFGSLICHQQPDRSFYVAAAQLPVCARCLGLYAGAVAGALAMVRPPEATTIGCDMRRWILLGAVPTAVTWGAELMGLWSPGNVIRFLAALPLGAAVAVTVNYVGCVRPPRTGPRPRRMPT
ncbi:MAG: DUF2085 domain-containing protein [Vicinamibacterales bacterium]